MRTDEDILAGILTVSIGGEERPLRELRIRELRAWKSQLTNTIGDIANLDVLIAPGDIAKMIGAISDMAGDKITDLVLAYDVDGTLGGPDALEEATGSEVYRAFRLILEAAFPFVEDLRGAIAQVRALMVAATSAPASSTSGPSPIGASTRKRSRAA